MIEVSAGKIVWKAGHHQAEKLHADQTGLADGARDLIKTMVGEIPRRAFGIGRGESPRLKTNR
jgi:hypothetical protein